ncbi:MAG: phage tail family protein [Clostridium sp.]|uniref:phage tail family protein n=1 Tax=Clostridium sp. TaxID=1506 RepID=UPI003044F5E9
MDKHLMVKMISNNKILEIGLNKNYRLLDIEGIESSDYELSIVNTAQFDGGVVVNRRVQNRPISLSADFIGDNQGGERKKLISFFNPNQKGVLIINYDGNERAIEYEIENFNSKITNIYDSLSFTVDLICPNPYWRDLLESKINIALWKGKFHFPLVMPKNVGVIIGLREPSLIVNANNVGDVESGIMIEFKALGTLKNPSLLNVNTGEFFKINKTMMAGEIIKVDTNRGSKNVMRNFNGIETNIINLIDLDSTFLQLRAGDNLFRYDSEENLNNLEISIYYNPYYLGV